MAEARKTITVLLGEEYIGRFDLLCTRLGTNRSQLLRNLLSGDPALIDVIATKAKTLQQVTIEDIARMKGGKTDE